MLFSLPLSLILPWRKSKSLLFFMPILLLLGTSARGATFTVSNLSNAGPGSFREALLASNASAGMDNIEFSVAGVISILSPLPPITDPVNVDGTTAPGYVVCGPPLIAIDGLSGAGNGIQILGGGSGSTLQALNVRNFPLNGIQFISADNCRLLGCYIGTNLNGTAAASNGQNGIQMEGGSDNNRLGGSPCDRNIISGNRGTGINVDGGTNDTLYSNYVGLNAAGTAAIGNGGAGINVFGGAGANQVGGGLAGQGNVVSGNGTGLTGNGIDVAFTNSCTVRGNYIGLNAAGNSAIGNSENGLSLNAAPNCIIGGTGPLDGNVIADHNFHAIVLNGGSNNVTIQGNRCGTNAAGTVAFGNDDSGVIVINSSNVVIGGNSPAHRNLFSGSISEYGIFLINADNATVQGNYIGTDVSGTAPLPNLNGGILILAGTSLCTIGGNGPGEANVIAFNAGVGVELAAATDRQILISRNQMFCNTGKGIELNGAGNNNQPAPVFGSVSLSGCSGTANPNNIIELFYDSLCTSNCQGKDYIATVTADGAGLWSYTGALNPGTVVATARDTGPPLTNAGNTSEFTCFTILPVEGLSLAAESIGQDSVRLIWSTTQELNLWGFEIEKSRDGHFFHAIGEEPVSGNKPEGGRYIFYDPQVGEGLIHYRIRAIDLNGDVEFSEVVSVLNDAAEFSIKVYPQPADQEISLEIKGMDSGIIHYQWLNLQGKILDSKEIEYRNGRQVQLSTAGLPNGAYFLTIHGSRGRLIQRVWVLRP